MISMCNLVTRLRVTGHISIHREGTWGCNTQGLVRFFPLLFPPFRLYPCNQRNRSNYSALSVPSTVTPSNGAAHEARPIEESVRSRWRCKARRCLGLGPPATCVSAPAALRATCIVALSRCLRWQPGIAPPRYRRPSGGQRPAACPVGVRRATVGVAQP